MDKKTTAETNKIERASQLSEGSIRLASNIQFVINGNHYLIGTDGQMMTDRRINTNDLTKLPSRLKAYSCIIRDLTSGHLVKKVQPFYRTFVFVNRSNKTFKTFVMIDSGFGDFDDRHYDSISMLAEYLGSDSGKMESFVDNIISGGVYHDDVVCTSKPCFDKYEKVPEETRHLIFTASNRNYSYADFDPNDIYGVKSKCEYECVWDSRTDKVE